MSEIPIPGSCLCGAVRFEVTPPFMRMTHCHCTRCRKASGTGHGTNIMAQDSQLRWLQGEDAIAKFDLATAQFFSKWFCKHCGSPVPRQRRGGQGLVVIPAGSLDGVLPISPSDHIFWDSRAAWGCESGGLPTHEAYPPGWAAPQPLPKALP